MAFQMKLSSILVLSLLYSMPYASFAEAQEVGPGAGGTVVLPLNAGGGPGNVQRRRSRRLPRELNINVDAMAIIADWRARQPQSQSGTPRRSGVTINGTATGRVFADQAVLFSCPGGGFLELEYSVRLTDGARAPIYGPLSGCASRQALVLRGGQLSCQWYTAPQGAMVRRQPQSRRQVGAEIVLPSNPPITITGECITEAAKIVPAQTWPPGGTELNGATAGPNGNCNASGVTVNGRATGHSAGCRR